MNETERKHVPSELSTDAKALLRFVVDHPDAKPLKVVIDGAELDPVSLVCAVVSLTTLGLVERRSLGDGGKWALRATGAGEKLAASIRWGTAA